jgi:hypothetical protein
MSQDRPQETPTLKNSAELVRKLGNREDPLLERKPLAFGWKLVIAILAVLGAVAGGGIGWAVGSLGCENPPCSVLPGLVGGILGASLAALGMAVLGVLVVRSFEEWASHKTKSALDLDSPPSASHQDPRSPASHQDPRSSASHQDPRSPASEQDSPPSASDGE